MPENVFDGDLIIDMTDGPNPIGSHLLRLWPADGEVRRRFGLGNREDLLEGDVVLDPAPQLAIEGDLFPFRASARAGRFAGGGPVLGNAPFMLAPGEDVVPIPPRAFQTFVSATPTGSINLKLRAAE